MKKITFLMFIVCMWQVNGTLDAQDDDKMAVESSSYVSSVLNIPGIRELSLCATRFNSCYESLCGAATTINSESTEIIQDTRNMFGSSLISAQTEQPVINQERLWASCTDSVKKFDDDELKNKVISTLTKAKNNKKLLSHADLTKLAKSVNRLNLHSYGSVINKECLQAKNDGEQCFGSWTYRHIYTLTGYPKGTMQYVRNVSTPSNVNDGCIAVTGIAAGIGLSTILHKDSSLAFQGTVAALGFMSGMLVWRKLQNNFDKQIIHHIVDNLDKDNNFAELKRQNRNARAINGLKIKGIQIKNKRTVEEHARILKIRDALNPVLRELCNIPVTNALKEANANILYKANQLQQSDSLLKIKEEKIEKQQQQIAVQEEQLVINNKEIAFLNTRVASQNEQIQELQAARSNSGLNLTSGSATQQKAKGYALKKLKEDSVIQSTVYNVSTTEVSELSPSSQPVRFNNAYLLPSSLFGLTINEGHQDASGTNSNSIKTSMLDVLKQEALRTKVDIPKSSRVPFPYTRPSTFGCPNVNQNEADSISSKNFNSDNFSSRFIMATGGSSKFFNTVKKYLK